MKRLNLVIPENLYDEVCRIAKEQCTDVTGVIRQFIKIGLLVNEPNVKVMVKDENGEREVVFVTE
jgi:hypothetical protein